FTWKGFQCTFNRGPQGYKHSLTIPHNALAKVLAEIPVSSDNIIYQYIDDILIGGDQEGVKDTMEKIQGTLLELGLEVPDSKCQGPAQEIKFLGVWWTNRVVSIPQDTLENTEQGQNPSNAKELQQILGALGYWHKHIPDFSIIARPLYTLLRKGKSWEWTKQHTNALRLFQQLGPIHPTNP
ncbi:TF29 protein, partial [Brachypteracias leptosomus]|nr:TF29 protein [Brachypteracias leptosomus]